MTESVNLSEATLPHVDHPRSAKIEIFLVHVPEKDPVFSTPPSMQSYDEQNAYDLGVSAASYFYEAVAGSFFSSILGTFIEEIAFLDLLALLNNNEQLSQKAGGVLMVWDEDVNARRLKKLADQIAQRVWPGLEVSVKVLSARDDRQRLFDVQPLSEYVNG